MNGYIGSLVHESLGETKSVVGVRFSPSEKSSKRSLDSTLEPRDFSREFFSEGRLAILASGATRISNFTEAEGLDWDVVTYPYHPDAPGVGQRVDAYVFAITEQSEQKEAAFQVLATALAADVQTAISRGGKMSVIRDEEIQAQFGQDIAGVSGQNLAAFTEPKLALIQTFNNLPAASIIITAFCEVIYEGKDVNTALREADEKMNQAIQEELKSR